MRNTTLFVVGGLIGLMAAEAQAQMLCVPKKELVTTIAEAGEKLREMKLIDSGPGLVIQMWVNSQKGTWTMFSVSPTGTACILAIGEGFRDFPEA